MRKGKDANRVAIDAVTDAKRESPERISPGVAFDLWKTLGKLTDVRYRLIKYGKKTSTQVRRD